jgi:oxygen-dependent protoporphyrinogen oxidase
MADPFDSALSRPRSGNAGTVAVIGAGIAGLTAGYLLSELGYRVIVLEREAVAGGRMHVCEHHDAVGDDAASLFADHARHLWSLLARLELTDAVFSLETQLGFGEQGGVTAAGPGLLSLLGQFHLRDISAAPLAKTLWQIAQLRGKPLAHWATLDRESAQAWASRVLGERNIEQRLDAVMRGAVFAPLDAYSVSFLAMALSILTPPTKIFGFKGGTRTLARALSSRLDVRTKTEVTYVEQRGKRVHVSLSDGELEADWAVVALPAPIMGRVLRRVNELEDRLAGLRYSSVRTVSLFVPAKKPFSGPNFIVVPRSERSPVASVARQRPDSASGWRSLQAYVPSGLDGDAQGDISDAFCETIRQASARYVPELRDAGVAMKAKFWRHGVSTPDVGFFSSVTRYWAAMPAHRRVVVAGDSLGVPGMEACTETALTACHHILQQEGRQS